MKYKSISIKVFITIVLILSVFVQPLVIKVGAQEEQQTGNGISVSPIKVQRNYKGNDKDIINFTLLNNESTDATLSVTLKSFKLINNNQDISFDTTIEETILNWVRNFKNSVTLKPKEKYEYNLELNIDASTKPGGYLFGVFFESQGKKDEDDKSEAVIKQSIGVPLIVNVAGVEGISYGEVSLDTFDVSYNPISNNVHYSIIILNNSNQIIIPAGLFSLKKLNGIGPDQLEISFNQQGKIINSFSLRNFDRDIFFNQFVFGQYETTLNFLYGLENNVFTQKTTIFVIPIWIPLSALVVVYLLYRKFKKSKQTDLDEE